MGITAGRFRRFRRCGKPLAGDTRALASLDSVVALTAARGMKVILDMHNFGRYPQTTGNHIGQFRMCDSNWPAAHCHCWLAGAGRRQG